mmetsp:Transcript_11024/g.29386  ORF Transcript_11024/g.29386 Transcript_11024/m.29386 type:complete len:80 (+) Transcript_11024:833-1072(+)
MGGLCISIAEELWTLGGHDLCKLCLQQIGFFGLFAIVTIVCDRLYTCCCRACCCCLRACSFFLRNPWNTLDNILVPKIA